MFYDKVALSAVEKNIIRNLNCSQVQPYNYKSMQSRNKNFHYKYGSNKLRMGLLNSI